MRFRTRRFLLAILSTFSFLGLYWINVTHDITSNHKGKTSVKHRPRKHGHKKEFKANISNFFRLNEIDTKDEFVNLHKYSYSINSNKCHQEDIFLIVLVHSALRNVQKRHMVRTTYGSVTSYTGKQIVIVFMLGATNNSSLQNDIDMEFLEHGDIVQGNFQDSYKNLVQKHIMSIHWYRHHCNASYILKVDDDTFINPFRLVEYILDVHPSGLSIYGVVLHHQEPNRKPKSKYYTSLSEYPFQKLPIFCLGLAYLTTPETWNAMYDASRTMNKMSMDDVYVTGVLGMIICVQHHSLGKVMYFCKAKEDIEVEQLNRMVLLFDRSSLCKNKAFLLWNQMAPRDFTYV